MNCIFEQIFWTMTKSVLKLCEQSLCLCILSMLFILRSDLKCFFYSISLPGSLSWFLLSFGKSNWSNGAVLPREALAALLLFTIPSSSQISPVCQWHPECFAGNINHFLLRLLRFYPYILIILTRLLRGWWWYDHLPMDTGHKGLVLVLITIHLIRRPYTALCSWVLIQSFFHMGQFQITRLDSHLDGGPFWPWKKLEIPLVNSW